MPTEPHGEEVNQTLIHSLDELIGIEQPKITEVLH